MRFFHDTIYFACQSKFSTWKVRCQKKYPGLKYIIHITNVKPGQTLAKISHELLTKVIVSCGLTIF